MSNEFDFSKFVDSFEKKDSDKRDKQRDYVERFKDHPIRKLNKMTRELWQNRIKWIKS